jgi:hypothetical integral membrane protein (TIGR02206 family)
VDAPEVGLRAHLLLGSHLSSQALITPDLHASDFPSHSFVTFFALHLLVVWAAIYLTWGYGLRPGWRSYRFAVITTLTWGAFTLIFNTIAGSDYGFLNRKPVNGSALDFLGPWPSYVLAEVVIVGAVWALMTWPWEIKRQRQLSMTIAGETHPWDSRTAVTSTGRSLIT